MRIIAAVMLSALALAGCNKGSVNETNASIEEVANKVAESNTTISLLPGRWETSGELVELNAPGLPPQAQEMMKKQMSASASKIAVCLRPEDVEKPNAGFFGQTSPDCRFDHYRMGGGQIDAKMTCTPPGGGSMTTTMTGTYARDRYDMNVSSQMSGMGGEPMTMRMKVGSTRTGECTGSEIQADTKA